MADQILFEAGSTTHVTSWSVDGDAGNVIEIDSDGTIVWNGGTVAGIRELDNLFSQKEGQEPAPEIHLRPARRVKYDVVANVLASAQRHNMTKLGFANVSEYAD